MGILIAVVGKGGTGKSTVSSMLVRLLRDKGVGPVFAVDADPNSTLAPMLGAPSEETISGIREEVLKEKAVVTGIPKERLLTMKIEECLFESKGFDVLTMGQPEGPSCYCYVNNLLRGALTRLRANYSATVVDNEAGMEHLSRMNTDTIDCMVMVCEPTVVSARAVARINALSGSLPVGVERRVLVWNKVRDGEVPAKALAVLADETFDDVIMLPADASAALLSVEEGCAMDMKIPDGFEKLLNVWPRDSVPVGKG